MKIKFAYKESHFLDDAERRKLFITYKNFTQDKRVLLNLRLLIPIFLIFPTIIFIATTGYIYYKFYRSPDAIVSYFDVINPINWLTLNEKKAAGLFDIGKKLIDDGKTSNGIKKIRKSLATVPENSEVRLTLAKYYSENQNETVAIQLLKDGFQFNNYDSDYADLFFNLSAEHESFTSIIEISEYILNNPLPKNYNSSQTLYYNYIRTLFLNEKFNKLLKFIKANNFDLTKNFEVLSYNVRTLLNLERIDEAVKLLNDYQTNHINNRDYIKLIATLHRKKGEINSFRQYAEKLISMDVNRLDSYLFYIKGLNQGDIESRNSLFIKTLSLFGNNNDNLLELTKFAEKLPSSKLADKCLEVAKNNKSEKSTLLFFIFIQSLLHEGKWDEAKNMFKEFKNKMTFNNDSIEEIYNYGFLNIIFNTSGIENKVTKLSLRSYLRKNYFDIDTFLNMSRMLSKNYYDELALYLIEYAVGLYPESFRIKKEFEYLNVMLVSKVVEEEKNEYLENANLALNHLNSLMDEKDYASINLFLKLIDTQQPVWINNVSSELARIRVILDFETLDILYAKASARQYLSSNRMRGFDLLKIAAEYKNNGKEDIAWAIAEEIALQVPDLNGIRDFIDSFK